MDNAKTTYVRSLVFDAITHLLPTMGRDFVVAINFEDTEHIKIDIKALTKMGEIVKEELMKHLQSTLTELITAVNRSNQNGREQSKSGTDTNPLTGIIEGTDKGSIEGTTGGTTKDK